MSVIWSIILVLLFSLLALWAIAVLCLDEIFSEEKGEMVEPRGGESSPEDSPFRRSDDELTTLEKYAIDSGDLKDGRAL